MRLKEHQLANRAAWQKFAARYVEPAEEGWATDNPHWGICLLYTSDAADE